VIAIVGMASACFPSLFPLLLRATLPLAVAAFSLACSFGFPVQAAEVLRLDERNWNSHAPQGKEVDAIYGDWVLRNELIVAVVANPIAGRNANMTTRNVGGAVIDLTARRQPNDQLTAFFPAPRGFDFREARHRVEPDGTAVLVVRNLPADGEPQVEVEYRLSNGDPFLRVRSRVFNASRQELVVPLRDEIRADTLFRAGWDGRGRLGWVYDSWFRQAYGVLVEVEGLALALPTARGSGTRPPYEVDYLRGGSSEVILRPGGRMELERLLICAPDTLSLRRFAGGREGVPLRPAMLRLRDADGPVEGARVDVRVDGEQYGSAYSQAMGQISTALPHGRIEVLIESVGRPSKSLTIPPGPAPVTEDVEMDQPGYVVARITDGAGKPIPCKVQFIGKEGTPTPHFFHEAGDHLVHNLRYSHDGQFRQPLAPGRYEVIVSYGPEHDAVFTDLEVTRGRESPLVASLDRVVNSRGWISAELHSHSSPSGDNVSSQRGRVLNLLAEQIEFAPCTEHNRIDSYQPHLEALGVAHLMATCPGIELTRSPLSLNHQNAFPLVHRPRTQDGGGPATHADPVEQVRRLAYWDDRAEKIVQANHPNIIEMFFDGNLDGRPDEAHRGMLPHLDLIEVHPLHRILEPARVEGGRNTGGNRINSWLQMLNQGMWLPGVVNTDAHWNHHGSGWLRNYIYSPVDDPAKVEIAELVRSLRKGRVVMSNGPFLEVFIDAPSSQQRGLPGDTILAADGKVRVHLRVQCSNWLDIDRVQILVNGRRPEELNFTRRSHPDWFGDGVVKVQRSIPLELERDAHIIVVAIGEGTTLGRVMGEQRGSARPIAVSNPVFIDVDGGGFRASGDTLGDPLPVLSR
jgi:hypothetical protein